MDRVQRIKEGESVESEGACDPDSGFLAVHFPGCPVVPGVVMLDWGIESALLTLEGHRTSRSFDYRLESVTSFKFRRFLKPAQRVRITTQVKARSGSSVKFRCRVLVDGRAVANGNLVLCQNKPDGADHAESAAVTEDRIATSIEAIDFDQWCWFDRFSLVEPMTEADAVFRIRSLPAERSKRQSTDSELDVQLGDRSVYPPALILEGLAQAGVELIRPNCPDGFHTALTEVESLDMCGSINIGDEVRFNVRVVEAESDFRPLEDNFTRILGRASVMGRTILETEFLLAYAQPPASKS